MRVVGCWERPLRRKIRIIDFVLPFGKIEADTLSTIIVIAKDDPERHINIGIRQLEFRLPLVIRSRAYSTVVDVIAQKLDEIASISRTLLGYCRGHVVLALIALTRI